MSRPAYADRGICSNYSDRATSQETFTRLQIPSNPDLMFNSCMSPTGKVHETASTLNVEVALILENLMLDKPQTFISMGQHCLSFVFKKMSITRPLLRLFSVFFKLTIQFVHQINVKNVHQVKGAGIRTHDLSNMSRLPLPLDQGSRPVSLCFCEQITGVLRKWEPVKRNAVETNRLCPGKLKQKNQNFWCADDVPTLENQQKVEIRKMFRNFLSLEWLF